MALLPGVRFSTRYEDDCEVVTEPDEFGQFEALDSEGVLCGYQTNMVTAIAS